MDQFNRNVIRAWLDEVGATAPDREALQALIDICEFSGFPALAHCTLDLGNNFYALKSRHAGGIHLSPVCYRGPFSDTEITFLAGATIERKRLKPRYAADLAAENLEALQQAPMRRRREPVT